ncbi:DUF3131 domain-containing protein [Yersinia ruckeri]|uniref:DUF3131 domain-containing protein n=1 Tax=Yersinia ruckeri TaxID=29486 RepID=UPI0022388D35|nr:DUF3131 domain-containing protein [Yersinia ruckeri]MCW6542534.1 DUF3131 domain-containing protein [Yersinia ruckeri]MCW6591041.1 DUF3131 domain-containing protein [Yersinia ruckeri]UZX92585.1 DUF3131 domain-containing protein [Yersinia ruckeri]
MSFKYNLLKARSYLAMVIGILIAFSIVIYVEKNSQDVGDSRIHIPLSVGRPLIPTPRPLSAEEIIWAKTAWQYFINNTQPSGLVNSVDQYPSTTMWDTSSYFMALISAQRIGIIQQDEFDQRISNALAALAKLPLVEGKLPNKAYNTQTLAMVNYNNQPSLQGIGWSAIDISRMMVPLNILVWNYPQHAVEVNKVISRWHLDALVANDQLQGSAINDKTHTISLHQEGRMGYEQYAARTLQLVGINVSLAIDYTAHLKFINVEGILVPDDDRVSKKDGANTFIVSEPYMLTGLELGFDDNSSELAWRVFKAQENRFQRTGIYTSVSEDHVDQAPYFIYSTLHYADEDWAVITEKGERVDQLRQLSTKTAFSWYALWRTPYSEQTRNQLNRLMDQNKGWYSGIYEVNNKINTSFNANTNGVVLESLAFINSGKLLCIACAQAIQPVGAIDKQLK